MAKSNHLSKFLSYVLRHRPDEIGITLDPQGWATVDTLLQQSNVHGYPLTRLRLEEIVKTNSKQRFSFSADGSKIRANQGHSVSIDLGLSAQVPPAVLFHGTAQRFLASIFATGLHSGDRQHVHLSKEIETAYAVGKRHGKPVILEVASQEMHADGFFFFHSDNGVWLTDSVAPRYLKQSETS